MKEEFLKNVSNHTLVVFQDSSVYRSIRFSSPNTNAYHFSLTTWPGYLCVSGDMGCYVFKETVDMFSFFRQYGFNIQPGYWSGKLAGVDKRYGCEHFSHELFEKRIREYVKNAYEFDKFDAPKEEVLHALKNDLFVYSDYEKHEAIAAAVNFSYKDFVIKDADDMNFNVFNTSYIWSLYAILWGIQQYDVYWQRLRGIIYL